MKLTRVACLLLVFAASSALAQLITSQTATPASTTSTIAWTTPASANSQIRYGLTSSYGSQTTLDATLVTSHSVSITSLVAATLYHYQVVSIDSVGNTVTSPDGTFTTVAGPVITTNPVDTTACNGGVVSLLVGATGAPTPTVQWKQSIDGGSTYQNITGATSVTYSFTAASSQTGYKYEAVFTNTAGSTTTTAATLTVNIAPVVTAQPLTMTGSVGGTAHFTSTASGTPSPAVQWQSSPDGTTWTNVSGATSTTITVSSLTVGMSGTLYRAVFTNSCGSVNSSSASLTVLTGKTYNVSYSASSNLSSGAFVQAATLSGSKYLFTSLQSDATNFNPTGIANACFWLDSSPTNNTSTLFASNSSPTTQDSHVTNPDNPIELGMKFSSNVAGQLTAVRFWKSTLNVGTHVGSVWSSAGALLSQVTFTNETASGWQEQALTTPVTITPGITYTVSYNDQSGHYPLDLNYFGAPVSSGALTAPVGAGVYAYTTPSVFPVNVYQNGNFWVDAKFTQSSTPPSNCSYASPYNFSNGNAPIAFKQVNSAVPGTPQTSVPVVYTSAQVASDLNVVVVGWNNVTSTVSSVTDTKGNTYTLAIGPTRQGTTVSQSIYYAKNIAVALAGANTVTVTMNTSTPFIDVRILEYSGLSTTAPFDVASGSSGAASAQGSVSSTNAVTTSSNELAFGAGTTSGHYVSAGGGYTSRIITSPDGDIAMDGVLTNPGANNANAVVNASNWVMQFVAFKPGLSPKAWDTTTVANGMHTITQVVTKSDTTTETDVVTLTVNNTAHQAALSWTAGAHTNAVTYNIGRSITSGGPFTTIASGLSSTSYVDTSVVSGTTYYYVAIERDSVTALQSTNSNQVTAVIP